MHALSISVRRRGFRRDGHRTYAEARVACGTTRGALAEVERIELRAVRSAVEPRVHVRAAGGDAIEQVGDGRALVRGALCHACGLSEIAEVANEPVTRRERVGGHVAARAA